MDSRVRDGRGFVQRIERRYRIAQMQHALARDPDLSNDDLAHMLGVTRRTVVQYRKEALA